MPATAAANVSPSASDQEVAAEITQRSTETKFVPSLLTCARSIEHLGFTAEPRFERDASGQITGLGVRAIGSDE